jgi:hypothetical protein
MSAGSEAIISQASSRSILRNTSHVGEICRTQLIAAITLRGKTILLPLGDHQRYDFVIEEEGTFYRIQSKNGRLRNGAINFYPCSVDSRSKEGGCVRKSYDGHVEFFGVYCPELKKCYLVPLGDVSATECSLRIDPPRNGQRNGIRWAVDYEIRRDPTIFEAVSSEAEIDVS